MCYQPSSSPRMTGAQLPPMRTAVGVASPRSSDGRPISTPWEITAEAVPSGARLASKPTSAQFAEPVPASSLPSDRCMRQRIVSLSPLT